MAPKILLTGITGYIGGDFLYLISQKHPDWDLTALVRNSEKGAKVAAVYPKIRLVYGDLDSADLIEEEASTSDIVYHFANCDHEASARAIAKGLAKKDSKGFWIHTSGTGILTYETVQKNAYGDEMPKAFNDWHGIGDLMSHDDAAPHRNVDKIVLAAYSNTVKTAIVCPPTIYGQGRGPDNQRSVQAPFATESILKQKKGFVIGNGKNIWHQVHVHDLSDLYLLIGEAAANGGPPATWNDEGYYLAESGSFAWGDVLRAIANDAHEKGLLPDAAAEGVSVTDAQKWFANSQYYIGTTSKGESIRGKKLLGWKPHRPSLMEEVPAIIDVEARRLGLTKGHAEKVGM